MAETDAIRSAIRRIEVRIRVGDSLLAASDDPLFLGLRGGGGREFRLTLAHGRSLRRKAEDHYVLAAPDDGANVEKPELNDPGAPPLDADAVTGVYLRKGLDPVPNVRGVGEMDDRLEVLEAEVALQGDGAAQRWFYAGPVWLGLAAGMVIELARLDAA